MAQFKAGLYKKEVLDAMTRVQNIRANLQILRNLGYSEEVIKTIRRRVLEFARRL